MSERLVPEWVHDRIVSAYEEEGAFTTWARENIPHAFESDDNE